MTLDDTLWDLLDKVHLGEFFDEKGIPPIVFPAAIVAVIAIIAALLMMGGSSAPATECGDALCVEPENCSSCPEDCGACREPTTKTTEKDIRVYVQGGYSCTSLDITLKSADGTSFGTKNAPSRFATFEDVSAEEVYAQVSSDDSESSPVKSSTIKTADKSTLSVSLPEDYCKKQEVTGSISVTLKDSATGEPLSATVRVYDNGGTVKNSKYVAGSATFSSLPANEYYYLTVQLSGYADYTNEENAIYVTDGSTETISISMNVATQPIVVDESNTKIQACVSGLEEGITPGGEIGLYDIDGELKSTHRISDCELMSGTVNTRCGVFNADPSKQYYVGVTDAPSGCAPGPRVGPIQVPAGQTVTKVAHVECNLVAEVRARVLVDNTSVTDDVTIELFLDQNDSKIGNMYYDSEGYTDYLDAPANRKLYIKVTDVPSGYMTAKKMFELDPDDNETITITLQVPPPPPPQLIIQGARLPQAAVEEGGDVLLYASKVYTNESTTALNPSNGLSVSCAGSWASSTWHTATYNSSLSLPWVCNMTAPASIGEKTVVIRATKTDHITDSKDFKILVYNESSSGAGSFLVDRVSMTPFSPEILGFNITYFNGSNYVPVDSVYESSILVYYEDSQLRSLIANSSLTKESDGTFKVEFPVPFAGNYSYSIRFSIYVNGSYKTFISADPYEYIEILSGGGSTNIICELEETIAKSSPDPNSPNTFNVSTGLIFAGARLPNQDIAVNVNAGSRSETYIVQTDESGLVNASIPTFSSECRYSVNCESIQDDSIVSNPLYLYVVNAEAPGINYMDCPISGGRIQCGSIEDLRNCYAYLLEYPESAAAMLPIVNNCASQVLSGSCSTSETISCIPETRFAQTSDSFTINSSITLEGTALPNENIIINISSGVANQAYTKNTGATGLFSGEIPTFSNECKYTLSCQSADNSSIYSNSYLYVVNPSLASDPDSCPASPSSCDSEDDLRNCYSLYLQEDEDAYSYNELLSCADNVFPDFCAPSGDYSNCRYGVTFRIKSYCYFTDVGASCSTYCAAHPTESRCLNRLFENTTDYLTYFIDGTPSGQTKTLSNATDFILPTIAEDATTQVRYQFADVTIAGGNEVCMGADCDPDCTNSNTCNAAPSFSLAISQSDGTVTAVGYCPLACSGVEKDLNGNGIGEEDSDKKIMASIIDNWQIFGRPPYSSLPYCVDVNGDGEININDYLCLIDPMSGYCEESCVASSQMEVCLNSTDDDCNGQTDRVTYYNGAYLYNSTAKELINLCECNKYTPCEMLFKSGIGSYTLCSKIGANEYSLKTASQIAAACTPLEDASGVKLYCAATDLSTIKSYVCDCSGSYCTWTGFGAGAGTYPDPPWFPTP